MAAASSIARRPRTPSVPSSPSPPSSSRSSFASFRARTPPSRCRHHRHPRFINILLGHPHLDISARSTSSRSSPSAPGPCRPGPHPRQPRHHRHDSSGHHEPLHRRYCSGEFPRHLCSASSHLDSITTATRSPCLLPCFCFAPPSSPPLLLPPPPSYTSYT